MELLVQTVALRRAQLPEGGGRRERDRPAMTTTAMFAMHAHRPMLRASRVQPTTVAAATALPCSSNPTRHRASEYVDPAAIECYRASVKVDWSNAAC